MKISKLFHWLYASVMMLPLFASIVFAIYTRNENSTFTQSVIYDVNKVVNFNQLYKGDGTTTTASGGTATFLNNEINIVVDTDVSTDLYFSVPLDVNFNSEHLYYLKSNSNTHFMLYTYIDSNFTAIRDDTLITLNKGSEFDSFFITTDTIGTYTISFNIFDITQMFGNGNEATTTQFNDWYSGYYDYTLGTLQLLNVDSITYNDTDVGSQLIYTLYNSTNNYFNVTNFLGLNNLYDWISINVFNGTPALAFSLFYMLLSYWLLVSIFWLVFDVVMYVPNLAHRWLDKGSLQ